MATAQGVLNIARGEIGYVAKQDPLAGSKYGRELAAATGNSWWGGNSTAVPWCALFVSWVLWKAGQACPGAPSAACADFLSAGSSAGQLVSYGGMQAGDIVIFDWKDGGIQTDYIGFVETPGSGSFVCIEGNTAGGSVARQTRYPGNVLGIVRPRYDGSSGGDASVRSMQGLLNGKLDAFGLARVSATGAYDAQTQAGLVRLLQASDNLDYACGLAVDGVAGAATRAAMDAHPVGLGHETQGNDVWAAKAMLVGNGWTEVGLGDWLWGATEDAALRGHQPYWGLASTGVCDGATLRSLVSAASV